MTRGNGAVSWKRIRGGKGMGKEGWKPVVQTGKKKHRRRVITSSRRGKKG